MSDTASVATTVTQIQYDRGLEMWEAQATAAAIAAATDLTTHQVAWLSTKGDAAAGMPRWIEVVAEKRAKRNRYQATVGESIALGAAGMIDKAQQIAGGAQQLILAMLASHMQHSANPAIKALKKGQLADESDIDWADRSQRLVSAMAMDRDLRDTLKMLQGLADIKKPAEVYALVWANARLSRSEGLAATLRGFTGKVDLSAEAILPAEVTTVEQLPGAEQGLADPLDIDPDFAGMSLADLEAYDVTKELPAEAYGPDGEPDRLPPDADIGGWDPEA